VGSSLLAQHAFDARFNSTNIETIAGRTFDLLVCAGARAEKWKANADPAGDRIGIERLLAALAGVKAERAVLISTVDVFADPREVDESAAIDTSRAQAYGANRRALEVAFAERFGATIIRLPGVYGPGLKKNIIYDLLHGHETAKIDSRGVFQFYGVRRLWKDVGTALDHGLGVVHLVTEPVSVADIAVRAFGLAFDNRAVDRPARYDVRTKYAALFDGAGSYIEDRERELEGIRRYVADSR